MQIGTVLCCCCPPDTIEGVCLVWLVILQPPRPAETTKLATERRAPTKKGALGMRRRASPSLSEPGHGATEPIRMEHLWTTCCVWILPQYTCVTRRLVCLSVYLYNPIYLAIYLAFYLHPVSISVSIGRFRLLVCCIFACLPGYLLDCLSVCALA